jgi:hypothetical protein
VAGKSSWFKWEDLGNLGLVEDDISADLLGATPARGLAILGLISLEQFLEDLEHLGLLTRLRRRGYVRFRPSLEKIDLFSERLRLFGSHPDHPEELRLMDVKSHRAALETPWKQRYRALGWDWVELQDPVAPLSPYRPLLPGQKHPGLGMFWALTQLMMSYVEKLQLEALTAIPMYFHNAVLYSESFRFLLPEVQGRFQAMCRDLLHDGLSPASWWVERREVVMVDRSTGEQSRFKWEAALIVRPLGGDLAEHLQADAYQQRCSQAMESVEFRICPSEEEG